MVHLLNLIGLRGTWGINKEPISVSMKVFPERVAEPILQVGHPNGMEEGRQVGWALLPSVRSGAPPTCYTAILSC